MVCVEYANDTQTYAIHMQIICKSYAKQVIVCKSYTYLLKTAVLVLQCLLGVLVLYSTTVKYKVQVFNTPQVVNCLKVESDAALYFPVDLTGNLILIEK